jgi:hypothetical protein
MASAQFLQAWPTKWQHWLQFDNGYGNHVVNGSLSLNYACQLVVVCCCLLLMMIVSIVNVALRNGAMVADCILGKFYTC